MKKKIIIPILSVGLLSSSLLVPVQANDYVKKIQSLDFAGMMGESYASNLDSFMNLYKDNKTTLGDKYAIKVSDNDISIQDTLNSIDSEKGGLSSSLLSDTSSLKQRYEKEVGSLSKDISSKINKEEKDYVTKDKANSSDYSRGSKAAKTTANSGGAKSSYAYTPKSSSSSPAKVSTNSGTTVVPKEVSSSDLQSMVNKAKGSSSTHDSTFKEINDSVSSTQKSMNKNAKQAKANEDDRGIFKRMFGIGK